MALISDAVRLGDLELKNRLVLAPLTRARSGETRIPNELMVDYYRQRANAGLILTEATVIAENAVGYEHTPGLWNEKQVAAWKNIIDAVHEHSYLLWI